MAIVEKISLLLVAGWSGAALTSCTDLVGLNDNTPIALSTLTVVTANDFQSVRVASADNPDLRLALVWGTQWLPEPLCFFPPESAEVAAVIAAGCRDVLSFTPDRVAVSTPLVIGATTQLEMTALPGADVMVGDITSRVAYGSLVLFDDRDHNATLDLSRPRRAMGGRGPGGGGPDLGPTSSDIVYGASFVSMTTPDTRLAFREGTFTETGFYPRHGCDGPLAGFSILSANGFSIDSAIAATLAGKLPDQTGGCSGGKPESTPVTIPFRTPSEVSEVACEQRSTDSQVRYRQPPEQPIDLTNRTYACAKIPKFDSDAAANAGVIQLIIASAKDDTCHGITHYTLVGCDDGSFSCSPYEWDLRDNPPMNWPCPVTAP
jgi:hypothetical protein